MGLLPLSRFSYRQDVLRGHRILSENIPRHQHLHWNLFFKLEAYVSGEVKKQIRRLNVHALSACDGVIIANYDECFGFRFQNLLDVCEHASHIKEILR